MLSNKLKKKLNEKTDDFEMTIATTLTELESSSELKAHLRDLVIRGAKEFDVKGKKVIVIYVPMPQLKQYQKIHSRLVRELEKKFSGKHVIIMAWRRVMPPERPGIIRRNTQKRPYSRSRKAVEEAYLDDICYPAEIVGKRLRVKLDGDRVLKVFLDKAQSTVVDHKLETFSAVYHKLTGRVAHFSFPEYMI